MVVTKDGQTVVLLADLKVVVMVAYWVDCSADERVGMSVDLKVA